MIAIKKDAMRYRDPETGKFVGVSLIGGDAPSGSGGTPVEIDGTLTQSGKAADAKAVGDQLSTLKGAIDAKGDPTDEQVKNAVDDYLTKNPASVITSAAIQDINIKKWIGRKIVVDGSSITSGGTGVELPTWPSFIKDIFALSAVYNHAVGGTPWFVYGASNVMSRVAEYETDADAVIIMGDYNGIGTVTSNESINDGPSLDGGYYAKLKYLAETLIEKYPLCPIIWVVEPPRGSGECTPMHHDGAYVRQGEMIEEVAELYGFAHCNLMKNTLFRPWVQANYDATTKDGTHPWNNIQRTMAQIIAETMKRTPIIYQESYVLDTSGSTGSGSGGSGDAGGEENPGVNLTEIKASLSSSYEMYTTDTLDALRQYLTVKAVYSDLSEKTVTDYAIIGELTEGTSTLTIEYGGATTTVNVTVSSGYRSITVEQSSLIASNYNGKYVISATVGESRSTIGLKDYANTGVSDPISVMPGTVVRFFSNPDQGKGVGYPSLSSHDIVFFDADDKIISSGNAVSGSWSFTVPDNASTFIVTVANNSTYYFISYTPGA